MKVQTIDNTRNNSYNPNFGVIKLKLKGHLKSSDFLKKQCAERLEETVQALPEYKLADKAIGNREATLTLGAEDWIYALPQDKGFQNRHGYTMNIRLEYDNVEEKGKKWVPKFLKRIWYGDERVVAKYRMNYSDDFTLREVTDSVVNVIKQGKGVPEKDGTKPLINKLGTFRNSLENFYLEVLKLTDPKKYEKASEKRAQEIADFWESVFSKKQDGVR